jgi:hypothetical protein
MDKKTKMYVGIGLGIVVVYLIWKNRKAFSSDVNVQTPLGGVRASVGGGAITLATNPSPSAMATSGASQTIMATSGTSQTNNVLNGEPTQPSAIM